MNFLQLVEHLARRVGTHQIPVNPKATRLQGLIESSALHYELMSKIAAAIYERNRCRRLTDGVERDATFEALAPIRLAVLRSAHTDVDAASLLEDVCVSLAVVFEQDDPRGPVVASVRQPRPPAPLVLLTPRRRWMK